MGKRDPNRITVRLKDDERQELETFCESTGENRSEVIRVALRLGLSELRKRPRKMVSTPLQSRLEALDAMKKTPTKRSPRR